MKTHIHILLMFTPLCEISESSEPGQIQKGKNIRCVCVYIRAGSDLEPF